MSEWYYADRQGQQRGPVQSQDLLGLRDAGQIDMDTLVWRNGMANWQAFATIANEVLPQPAEVASAPAPAVAPVVDGSYSMYDTATPIARKDVQANDPYAAPRAQVGSGTGVQQDGHVVYAGFWKRVAAAIIDTFAIGIPVAILIGIVAAIFGIQNNFGRGFGSTNPGMTVVSWLLQAVVFAWFYSSASMMATPGKLAIGIKVVRSDGETLTFLRGFGRYFAYMLSGLMIGIGYLMAAFTDRKQALHDMICDTVVVDKWAFTEHPERQDDTLGTVTKIVLGLGIVLFVIGCLAMCSMIAALAHYRG
ncbi:MAG: RDD family protein [Xanthomonadales bacterium]|nr:RDD family protein [Xanthomonadales bacterium]